MDRKDSHLEHCLNDEVEFRSQNANGFANFRFEHDALPEISKNEIDLSTVILNKKLAAPFIIGAMTGGTVRAGEINRRLALAAEKCQVGFALGSQRKMISDKNLVSSYAVKRIAPGIPLLFGNIGAVQLNYGVGAEQLLEIIDEVACDAFNFHLNPLQETVQPEGDTDFAGLFEKLRAVIPTLGLPVFIKEVGSGISKVTANKLRGLQLSGVETAGLGGTSWAKIESLRAENKIQKSIGELFAQWGLTTSESISICRETFPDLVVVASGGMRNGIEAAKALALGANAVAFALPLLQAAEKSSDAAMAVIERLKEELRTVMFLTGSKNIAELKAKKLLHHFDFTYPASLRDE